jgi:hypothetical protein
MEKTLLFFSLASCMDINFKQDGMAAISPHPA